MKEKLIKDYEGKLVKDPVDRGLGTMPIGMLLFKMSAPMVISMLVQACYNVVDSIFVARISEAALSALSLAFPVQFFIVAINIGTNIGMTAMISRSLGERKFENASHYAKQSLFLAIIYSIIFAFFGLFFSRPFFAFQTLDNEIIENGHSYLRIILLCSFGTFFQIPFEKMLQATGRSTESMITQLTGAIFNIIFDPILIFGLLGFPKLGIEGAAIATVTGQTLGAIVGYLLNKFKNKSINLDLLNFNIRLDMIANIYRIGIPSMVMDTVGCFMILLFNRIIIKYPQAVAIVGIYYKMESFVFMPLFGLNNGMVPIISYNYGSHNKERIKKVVNISLFVAIAIMTIGTVIFLLFPEQVFLLFAANDTMLKSGSLAFRIICTHFILAAINIILGSVMQATNKEFYSLIINFTRQLIGFIPIAYILERIFQNLTMVWLSFPISELIAFFLTIMLYKKTYKDEISKL